MATPAIETSSLPALSSGVPSSISVSSGSITLQSSSDLAPTASGVVSATATPTSSTDGTPSAALPLSTPTPTLTPPTPTFTLIGTSSPPTFIPQTSPTPSVFSSNLNTPPTTTSAPLLHSTSQSISVIVTTIVTVIGGSSTTMMMTSSLPTTLGDSASANAASRRMGAIAGATTGSIALILMALGAVFLYRRHRLRKALESSGQKREGRALLDGEEFDDDVRNVSTSMPSHPYPTHAFPPEAASTLNLIKSRTSETGSIFREEVWPPPEFGDPISKQGNQVDLSGAVDGGMGHTSYEPAGSTTGRHGSRQSADASILSAISSTSSSSMYSSNPSQYSLDPSPSTFEPRVSTSSSLLSLVPPARASLNTRPRRSSPLARNSTSDPKLWLTRNVRQTAFP